MQLKLVGRLNKWLLNRNWEKLAGRAFWVFMVTMVAYWLTPNYEATHWAVIFYLSFYFMVMTQLALNWSHTVLIEYQLLFGFGAVYFTVMIGLHIACLFSIDLYDKWVQGAGYYGVGALIVTIGIPTIYFKLKEKSHGRRNT
jgi:hypothetical protein